MKSDQHSQPDNASAIRWARVNDDPFEYAIQQGPHGDEFVKLLDGSCLRRNQCGVQSGDVVPEPDWLAANDITYSYRTITIECGSLEQRDEIYDWLIGREEQP